MSAAHLPRLRVKALQSKRRRGGLEFGPEVRELAPEDFGKGLAAIMAMAAILGDPLLKVTVVEDDKERPVSPEERDQLTAFLEAESLRVDPSDPPTPDAAEAAAEDERLAAEAAAKAEAKAAAKEAARKV